MNTNETIERSLLLGVSRILKEYGWAGERHSLEHHIKIVSDFITSGNSSTLRNLFERVVEKVDDKRCWGIFCPEYVHGVETMLSKFIKINELDTEGATFKFSWSLPKKISGNVFINDEECCKALRRLRSFGKTNINYLYIERYGLSRLKRDLKAAGYPNADIYVNTTDHVPDMFREEFSQLGAHSQKLWIYWPIMPLVVLSLNA